MAAATAMEPGNPEAPSGLKTLESGVSCPVCAASDITRTLLDHESEYGTGSARAMIDTRLPVSECRTCGFTFLDHEAEQVKQDALCRHFGVLCPDEIKAIRNRCRMTPAEFANATKLSEASLHRWEEGLSIQTRANDRYLRLLQDTETMERLDSVNRSPNNKTDPNPKNGAETGLTCCQERGRDD